MSLSKPEFRGKDFTNENLGLSIRVHKDLAGRILFDGVEAATILGFKNPWDALRRHVSEMYKVRGKISLSEDDGKGPRENRGLSQPEKIHLKEPGLIELLFKSKLPIAKDFKRWVLEDVIPDIRRQGFYALPQVVEEIVAINPDDVKALRNGSKAKRLFRKESQHRSDLSKDWSAMARGSRGGEALWEKIRAREEQIRMLNEEVTLLRKSNTLLRVELYGEEGSDSDNDSELDDDLKSEY